MVDGMEAGACSCDFDDEYPDVYSVRNIRARKVHRCDECHGEIVHGETYERASWMSDGRWSEHKRCIPCSRIARDYGCGVLDAGYIFAYVREHLGVNLRTGEVDDGKGEGWLTNKTT